MHTILRKTSEFLRKIFENSSIHGFPYIAHNALHFVEKLFWLIILMISFGCSYFAFSGQLKRYDENPTVLSIDIITTSEFSQLSFTVCTRNRNLTNAEAIVNLVKKFFNVDSSSEHYSEYLDFINTISSTNYMNMGLLKRFVNLPNVSSVDLLQIASEMHHVNPVSSPNYQGVMTELNMCDTSSDFFYYQSPEYFTSKTSTRLPKKNCSSFGVCRSSVTLDNSDLTAINRIELMSGDDFDYVELTGGLVQERQIKIDEIKADPKIRNFKPRSRKCKFRNEVSSKYYDVYTENLCKMDCRINRAKKLCGCIPFFYTVKDETYKFCNISGLLCLSEKLMKWYNATSCNCMKLCESTILTPVSYKNQNFSFDRMLSVDMMFPKTQIQRGVLFDFDDLLVGLGGSFALFLGLSFLCMIEVLYYFIEYCMDIIINCIKS